MKNKLPDEILLMEGENIIFLPRISVSKGFLGKTLEDALQTILEKHPQIIPGRQINSSDPPKFVLLRREKPVGGLSLDHLYVDDKGVLTLLETKLFQNPESRREVVGQIIEYGAYAFKNWKINDLKEDAQNYWSKRGKQLDDIIAETFGDDLEIESFWMDVSKNLQQGKIRLLIAGDEIRSKVKRMIEYLNREMQNAEVLGLEFKFYGNKNRKIVVVPVVIGQTKIITDNGPKKWTYPMLIEAFKKEKNKLLGERLTKILEWSFNKGCFMQAIAKYPTFSLRNKSNSRVISFYLQSDTLYLYFDVNKYERGSIDRDNLLEELKKLGLFEKDLDPNTVKDGRHSKTKISELTEEDFEAMIDVFDKYF